MRDAPAGAGPQRRDPRKCQARFSAEKPWLIMRFLGIALGRIGPGDPHWAGPGLRGEGNSAWCGRVESNHHGGIPHQPLKLARLPVPPRPHSTWTLVRRRGCVNALSPRSRLIPTCSQAIAPRTRCSVARLTARDSSFRRSPGDPVRIEGGLCPHRTGATGELAAHLRTLAKGSMPEER